MSTTSDQQKWEALARANEVRTYRAEMKRELEAIEDMTASLHRLADTLELTDPNSDGYAWWMHSLRAITFVKWARGVGVQRGSLILRNACVEPQRKLGELTNRERISLARAIIDSANGTERRKNGNDTWIRQVLEEVA